MKNLFVTLISITCSISLLVSCSNNEYFERNVQDSHLKEIYESIKQVPLVSLFNVTNTNSRSLTNSSPLLYGLTAEDIEYLNSLSKSEMESERIKLISQFNPSGDEKIDSLFLHNYEYVFNLIGGHQNMDKLIDFACHYIEVDGGWNDIKDLMPSNLTDDQSKLYIYTAICIDNISRPFFQFVLTASEKNGISISRTKTICDAELAAELAISGVGLSAEMFLDVVSGGTMTGIEAIASSAELMDIWFRYEACNGRFH